LIRVVAPETEICAWPATTAPPDGCAFAATLTKTSERTLTDASKHLRTCGLPARLLATTLRTTEPLANPWDKAFQRLVHD
jgi:hypothetical protein